MIIILINNIPLAHKQNKTTKNILLRNQLIGKGGFYSYLKNASD